MSIQVCWYAAIRNLVSNYRHFGGNYYLHLKDLRLIDTEDGGNILLRKFSKQQLTRRDIPED
jgi:hypothetical protein